MYRAYLGDTCILDAGLDIILEDPALELEDADAGKFTFTIWPDNPGYKLIESYVLKASALVFKREDMIIWQGQITDFKEIFDKALQVECEGDLALLDTTIQRPAEYHTITVAQYLGYLLTAHNQTCGAGKEFYIGSVTVSDPTDTIYRYTNWESTLAVIQTDLLDKFGGHLRIRYADGKRYLDYLKDCPRLSEQDIVFGENLMDYSKSHDASDIATVCIPLGAKLAESPIEALEARLTIKDVNGGSDELVMTEAVSRYGRITKVVTWDDVHVASILKAKGQQWLQDAQYADLTLELSAVDLADFGLAVDSMEILDEIRCVSPPHGMDRRFPLTKMTIHPLSPESNVYTLGSKLKTFSGSSSKATQAVKGQVWNQPSKSNVLAAALENAKQLINMNGDDGYISMSKNELLIMDTDDKETAQRLWRFNLNGLGYSNNGYEGPFNLAITMDGTIAGQFVAAHTIGADQISVEYTTEQEMLWRDTLEQDYYSKTVVETKLENTATSVTASVKAWAENGFYSKSQIDVSLDGIRSEVSTKVGASEVSSLIEQKADLIRLKADKIVWTSTYSSMSENGTLSCQNAEISGKMTTYSQQQGIEVSNGKVRGIVDNVYRFTLDATARYIISSSTYYGCKIESNVVHLATDNLVTGSGSGYVTATGPLYVITDITDYGGGSIGWTRKSYTIVNGMICSSL